MLLSQIVHFDIVAFVTVGKQF